MEIKTQDGTHSVASAGVGGTGLGLGIGALSLAVLQGSRAGNGILGGLLGGCNTTQCEQQVSALMAELAKEKAERYTDQVGTEVYKQFAKERNETQTQISALFAAIAQLDKTVSVNEAVTGERVTCLRKDVNNIYDVFKLVVPNSSVCPGWGPVTITPTPATTTAGA
jgi:hypothetical protein